MGDVPSLGVSLHALLRLRGLPLDGSREARVGGRERRVFFAKLDLVGV
jgi:hypothetical protein